MSVWRCLNGQRGGVFGGWVSMPGYDVTTASPGQFLIDTTSQVYQRVGRGSTFLVTNPAAGNTYTASMSLDSMFAPYSNLAIMTTLQINVAGVPYYFDHVWDGYFRLSQHVTSGVAYFNLEARVSYGVSGTPADLYANWWVFRGQY